MKREFVMLAQKYEDRKHRRGSYYWSIKYDGMRAFWDGGITRGKRVPWCDEVCTGLFSRYMKPIFAPDWWLDKLPRIPLDGELWIGPGLFQEVMSVCRRHEPDGRWAKIKYCIVDFPGLETVFDYGLYKSSITTCLFDHKLRGQLGTWASEIGVPWNKSKPFDPKNFPNIVAMEGKDIGIVEVVKQELWNPQDGNAILSRLLEQGHEGIILRTVNSVWAPERGSNMLKIKPWNDSEGTVIGCMYGRATDKGSKLLGMMGALIVRWDGPLGVREFQLSGFTDMERALTCPLGATRAMQIASVRPGEEAANGVYPINFPIGSVVTFKYRELSIDGVPKEARYWRRRS